MERNTDFTPDSSNIGGLDSHEGVKAKFEESHNYDSFIDFIFFLQMTRQFRCF